MEKKITAREANQKFARVLREAEEGREFVVTRRGRPVARITPIERSGKRVLTAEQKKAHARAMARARRGWRLNVGKLDRDSLYDRDGS